MTVPLPPHTRSQTPTCPVIPPPTPHPTPPPCPAPRLAALSCLPRPAPSQAAVRGIRLDLPPPVRIGACRVLASLVPQCSATQAQGEYRRRAATRLGTTGQVTQ